MTNGNGRRPVTVVLIHGIWLTPRSWECWADRYRSRGLQVLAPAWPGMEAEVEALNADPSPIGRLTVGRIVDHYEQVVLDLERPPIIMGHSLGGTFMQILLDRGLGAAGVGVASAAVKGVREMPLSMIRSVAPALSPFTGSRPAPLSPEQFHFAFANTVTREESDALYRRYHVPGATTVLREDAFANFHRDAPTAVDFSREGRAPLLLIAFGADHLVPPRVIRAAEERYDAGSVTEFREFPGRPHFPAAPGWEEVADSALAWAMHAAYGRRPVP
jgi:pimeloyl-ACP methyl ester carboxylesterase